VCTRILGGDLISLAFDFQAGFGEEADRDTSRGREEGGVTAARSRFTYISDVSEIPKEAMHALREGRQIQLLVLDCLHYGMLLN
jgi:hypothetical protein